MTRVVYVNGQYVPYAHAAVHAEDRGFQFADAVYEVCEVKDGRLVDETRHMARLARSLAELRIPQPMTARAWSRVLRETIRRNRVRDGIVYLQVIARRRPARFPVPLRRRAADRRLPRPQRLARSAGGDRRSRHRRHDHARHALGPLRHQDRHAAAGRAGQGERRAATGAKEAWFVDEKGYVTEGASSNAWIVDKEGRLVTRQVDKAILRGVTRTTLIDVLKREALELVERPFTVEEAKAAREAFITSATNIVMPVVSIDGQPIGNGAPGLLSTKAEV